MKLTIKVVKILKVEGRRGSTCVSDVLPESVSRSSDVDSFKVFCRKLVSKVAEALVVTAWSLLQDGGLGTALSALCTANRRVA